MFFRSTVLLACSLVVAWGLVEVFLRLVPSVLPPEVRLNRLTTHNKTGMNHPYIGHLHTPNSGLVIASPDFNLAHNTDAHGFRNAWPWPQQADIVIVGDSLTFGYGVEDADAWPALVDQSFPHLRVVNLGLIGTGPEQQARVYEIFGRQLRPKLLLVGFFLGNDFWDAKLYHHWLKVGMGRNYMVWRNFGKRGASRTGLRGVIDRVKSQLRQHSVLLSLLQHAHTVYRNWRRAEPKLLRVTDGSQLHLWPSRLRALLRESQPDRAEFRLVLQGLKRLQALAQEQGAQLLIVMQPPKEQIYLPLLGDAVTDLGAPLRAALEQAGMDYLDLTPAFRQRAQKGKGLFFAMDGHPNRQGYRLIAQEVVTHVQQHAAAYGLDVKTERTHEGVSERR